MTTTPINSQWRSVCYRLTVIRKGNFEIPNFGGLGNISGLRFGPIESPPTTSQYLSIGLQSFALSATAAIPMSSFEPPNSTPKMVPIEISSPHSYSTSIHTIGLYSTVWPQYTTRQTDDSQAIGKGRLCNSIGGPKTVRDSPWAGYRFWPSPTSHALPTPNRGSRSLPLKLQPKGWRSTKI